MALSEDGLTDMQRRYLAQRRFVILTRGPEPQIIAGPMTYHEIMMLKLRALRQLSIALGMQGKFRRPLESFGISQEEARERVKALLVRVVQPGLRAYARLAIMDMLDCLDPEWRGKLSVSDLGQVVDRNSPEVAAWRKAVLKRDGGSCQRCGATKDLHAHHMVAWASAPWLRVEVSNGITLCGDCHAEEHPESAELVRSCRRRK